MAQVLTTGVTQGGVANRLEINQFVNNERFFSLYIQAIQAMQKQRPSTDPVSYFQVAGIHGFPSTPWDNVRGPNNVSRANTYGGYCTHSTILFPTWHRAQLLLFEQILQQHAVQIASTYTVARDAWMRAANDLRQPYWDWASRILPPPQILWMGSVQITNPQGNKIPVENPLISYRFPQEIIARGPTSRRPDVNARLMSSQNSVGAATYKMLNYTNGWPAFSTAAVSHGGTSDSLEAIHNNIHNLIGGDMGNGSFASFDPIFFLHHTNVDRLLSMWSAINPNVWVTSGSIGGQGTATIPAGTIVNANTGLTPFRSAPNTFWTSENMRSMQRFRYTYPEFNGILNRPPHEVRMIMRQHVNRLYGRFMHMRTKIPAEITPMQADAANESESSEGDSGDEGVPDEGPWDWTARIQVKKFEVGSSFAVVLFLGSVPEDPNTWLTCSNFVGAHHEFVNGDTEECANCRNQADLVEEGFLFLNVEIQKHSRLSSLEPEAVVPYLTENLQWRAQKIDGSAITLEMLKVDVFATPLTYPEGELCPVLGERIHHPEITRGRLGEGAGQAGADVPVNA